MQLTRRQALVGAGAAAGTLLGWSGASIADSGNAPRLAAFDGNHQQGIKGEPPRHLCLVAFDLAGRDRSDLLRLLRDWTDLVPALVEASNFDGDTGERSGLPVGPLSITIGFGRSLFDGRFGSARPPDGLLDHGLEGKELEAERSGGDLLAQICGEDRQVVAHARRQLANAAVGIATQRWVQHGFRSPLSGHGQMRNLLGFIDGSANLSGDDEASMNRFVWLPERDPLAGGTYLVYRRIRFRLTAWDRKSLAEQEAAVGRRKASGKALDGSSDARLRLEQAPVGSHIRAVHPDANGGVAILRRSYNYDDGPTADGTSDAGMAFICFAADPSKQVARLLARMELEDQLNRYFEHTAGGVYAIPPAPTGEIIGERLLS